MGRTSIPSDLIIQMRPKMFPVERLYLAVVLIPLLLITPACMSSRTYSQSYVILMDNKEVGKETVNEKTDRKGNRTCFSEQEMESPAAKDKKRRIISAEMVFPEGKLFPASYSQESSAGASFDIRLEGGQIIKTLKSGKDSGEIKTPFNPDLGMLNMTVFHTIDYWIRQYDVSKGGQQFFKTYLLPAGTLERISIFPVETLTREIGGKALLITYYEMRVGDGLTANLWVDQNQRLCRLFILGANIDVVRSDLYAQLHAPANSKKS